MAENQKKGRMTLMVALACLAVVVGMIFLVRTISRRNFRTHTHDSMELFTRLNRAQFEASMMEQLTLVRQMKKMPSIKEYLLDPADERLKAAALKDFEAYQ